MNNEKPKYCTHPGEADGCFWCELSKDGIDCRGNRFFIDLAEVLEEVEEPAMILEEI